MPSAWHNDSPAIKSKDCRFKRHDVACGMTCATSSCSPTRNPSASRSPSRENAMSRSISPLLPPVRGSGHSSPVNVGQRDLHKGMPSAVIFLDVDGVLHPWQSSTVFQARCCFLLEKIVRCTAAVIVLSSTWRKAPQQFAMVQNLMALLELEPIYDCTKDLGGGADSRSEEIVEWLSRHPTVQQWIAIDDMDLTNFMPCGDCLRGHFVHTHRERGLTAPDAKLAIQLLIG